MTAALSAHVIVSRRSGFRLDVQVDAAAGQIVAVMGPSGAGKSTLLAALAGLARLDDGAVRIGDDVVATRRRHVRPERRGVVLLGQDPRLFPHLSAQENVAFGPRAKGATRDIARAEADEWLWRVGLDGKGRARPSELSGGQQQRVALARALAAAPRLVLLDEPLTSLDPQTAGEIRALLHEQLIASHATTVVVTHDAVDAVALAHRLIVLEAGRVTQTGGVRDVLRAPATRFGAVAAGLNRIVGSAREGAWTAGVEPAVVLEAQHPTELADGAPLAALFRPGEVTLERPPELSWTGALRLAREDRMVPGTWLARVVRMEQTPIGVRVHTGEPAVAVDLSAETVAELQLSPGDPVRLRVDPSAVRLISVASADGSRLSIDSAGDPHPSVPSG